MVVRLKEHGDYLGFSELLKGWLYLFNGNTYILTSEGVAMV